MHWDIGIDLGTQSVRVATLKNGPTFSAPALTILTVPEALILPRTSVPFVELSLVRPSM